MPSTVRRSSSIIPATAQFPNEPGDSQNTIEPNQMDMKVRQELKEDLLKHVLSLLLESFEILFAVALLAFYLNYRNGVSVASDGAFVDLYILCTVSGTLCALYLMSLRFKNMQRIQSELEKGIEPTYNSVDLSRSSSQKQLSNQNRTPIRLSSTETSKSSTTTSTKEREKRQLLLSECPLRKSELIVLKSKHIEKLFMSNLVFGLMEDFPRLCVVFYHIYISSQGFATATAMECLANEGATFWACMPGVFRWLHIQFMFSLAMTVFRLTYIRDLIKTKRVIFQHVYHIIQVARKSSSVLDNFKEGEVTNDEINAVVAVRQLLGNVLDDLPSDVGGDYKLLGFVRLAKENVFEAIRKYREYLSWRQENHVDAIREQILREDLCVNHMPGCERIQEVISHVPLVGFNSGYDTALVNCYYQSSKFFDVSALLRLEADEYYRYHIFVREWYSMVAHKRAMESGRCIRLRQVVNMSSGTPHYAKVARVLAESYNALVLYSPELRSATYFINMLASGLKELLFARSMVRETGAVAVLFEGKIKFLFRKLDPNVVPISCGGKASTSLGNDPTCAKFRKTFPISQFLGRFLPISLFKGVSSEEVDKVKLMQVELCTCERRYAANEDDVMGCVQLLRFLRSREGNIDEAVQAFQHHLDLRERYNLHEIRKQILHPMWKVKNIPYLDLCCESMCITLLYCQSKNGHIVSIFRYEDNDFPRLAEQVPLEHFAEFLRYFDEYQNILLDRLSRIRKNVVHSVHLDLSRGVGKSLSHFAPYMRETLKLENQIYPGSVERLFFGLSKLGTTMTRTSFHMYPRLLDRVSFFHNTEVGVLELCNFLGEEAVPASIGGKARTNRGTDSECKGPLSLPNLSDDLTKWKWPTTC